MKQITIQVPLYGLSPNQQQTELQQIYDDYYYRDLDGRGYDYKFEVSPDNDFHYIKNNTQDNVFILIYSTLESLNDVVINKFEEIILKLNDKYPTYEIFFGVYQNREENIFIDSLTNTKNTINLD